MNDSSTVSAMLRMVAHLFRWCVHAHSSSKPFELRRSPRAGLSGRRSWPGLGGRYESYRNVM